ncbi:RNA polymerase-binding transcription factor DksA [Photobacterium malacitanum]|uniref:RNA polymerase-binding transcription factor DksA n=1 Tax=Photobacterium malacitanum TaxID=2204294 RepID=A0A1Y6MB76_9GAMM|nr:RNA polymerase-binding transcription factor DksA [Photobacterium malacitanum]
MITLTLLLNITTMAMTDMNYKNFQYPLETEYLSLAEKLKNEMLINHLNDSAIADNNTDLNDLIVMAKSSFIPNLFDMAIRLEKVDAAVCSFKLGMYGLCADCEEEIEYSDLEQDPAQPRCKACREHSRYHHD